MVEKFMERITGIVKILSVAFAGWQNSRVPRLGAAIAYYAVFSTAPLMVLTVAVGGAVYGEDAAQQRLSSDLSLILDPQVALAVEQLVENSARRSQEGWTAAALSGVLLLIGATGAFTELKDALNTIWEVQSRPGHWLWQFVFDRLCSFALVLCIGVALLASLVFSTFAGGAIESVTEWLSMPRPIWMALDWTVALSIVMLMFALLYKLLPDTVVRWRDVWIGAAVAALLFTAGKALIGLYLSKVAIASAYGAAGSLIVILIWTYYSAQIFLFGAELTHATAKCRERATRAAKA